MADESDDPKVTNRGGCAARRGPSRLRAWAPSAILAAGVIAIWVAFSWPLPLHLADGIASSAHNTEAGSVRRMIPGDHLQLLYAYWLAGDMLAGRTPWFHNLYEFNTGDDAARFRVHAQYAPFSWVYAAFSAAAGRAAAMNLTGLVSLWLTAWLTMRLARRYAADDALAVLAGWLAILVPFRWVMLLGGSPTGYAMAWVPLLFLGVDILVRDLRPAGGFVAGLGLLFASWSDSHVLFFGGLACIGWGLVALVGRGGWPWRERSAWMALAKAAGAAALAAIPALVMLVFTLRHLYGSAVHGERAPAEVALYTPVLADFFRWAAGGIHGHAYIGWSLPALAALAVLGWLVAKRRDAADRRRILVFLLLLAGAAGVLLLSVGSHGPQDGLLWRAARKLLPPYRAIRQPAKILCLLPTLLSVGLAAGLSVWTASLGRRSVRAAACLLLALGVAWEMKAQIRATVCTLDTEQGAYRAAAEHARAAGLDPRALALPLWPGDSAYSSVYQHHASLYRIRMANGYSPAVRRDYMDGFFTTFRALNHGRVDDAALDALASAGIQSILFHEDLFPEKVSPFPAGRTLEALRRHPRLKPLAQDGRVWAFAILPREAASTDRARFPEPYAGVWPPARRVEGERGGARVWQVSDRACSGGAFGLLAQKGDRLVAPAVPPDADPESAWWVRARGEGSLAASWSSKDGDAAPGAPLSVASGDAWTWIRVAPPVAEPGDAPVSLALECTGGAVGIDVMLFQSAGVLALPPGGRQSFPASTLFRAGRTEPGGAVAFSRDRDPAARILYGPWRPLAPGRYRAELEVRPSAAPAGHVAGDFAVEGSGAPAAPVTAGGAPAAVEFVQEADLPFVVAFTFNRAVDLTVERVTLLRLE